MHPRVCMRLRYAAQGGKHPLQGVYQEDEIIDVPEDISAHIIG